MKVIHWLCAALLTISLPARAQGVNGAASQAQQSMNQAATMNMMMGGMLFGMAMAQKPVNPLMAMMAAMMLIQGMSLSSQAQQAGQTVAASSGPVVQLPPGSVTYLPRATAVQSTNINNGLAYLAGAGYKVNTNGTIQLPSGRIVTASAFGSSQSLTEMGFKATDIRAAQLAVTSATERVQKDLRNSPPEEAPQGTASFRNVAGE